MNEVQVESPIELQAKQNGLAVGPKGDSAYIIALKNGFVGTEAEWLASLAEDANIIAMEFARSSQASATSSAASAGQAAQEVINAQEQVQLATDQAEASAGSAINSANSAAVAAQKVIDAAAQVQLATDQAEASASSAVDSANSAAVAAQKVLDAAAQVQLATDQAEASAGSAFASANSAADAAQKVLDAQAQVQLATDQADASSGSAVNSENSAAAAAQKVIDCQAQVQLAIEQVALATTQKEQAAAQVALAAAQKDLAAAQAVISTNKAGESAASAVTASTKAGEALASYNNTQTLLANFFDPAVMALNSRGVAEGAVFNSKLRRVQAFIDSLQDLGIWNTIKFIWSGEFPRKERISTIYKYFTKIYSPDPTPNDAVQATELNQPCVSGNIAPNEKRVILNPNGSTRYISHPNIAFTANDSWSITICMQIFGATGASQDIVGNYLASAIRIDASSHKLILVNESSAAVIGNQATLNAYYNKNAIFTFVASGNGYISVYINGVLSEAVALASNFTLNRLLHGRSYPFSGKVFYYAIRNAVLSPSQIMAEYNLLRAIIPDIENVTIGTQQWASSNLDSTCTPQGNLINEVQINTNTERMNGNDLNTWGMNLSANGAIISATQFRIDTGNFGVFKATPLLSEGKWYKISFNVTSTQNFILRLTNVANNITLYQSPAAGNNHVGTVYVKIPVTTDYRFLLYAITTVTYPNIITVNSLIVTEIGWANSQELYDAVYASTAGTIEQKTYAAVKAAAMWCYPDNDSIKGAIYAKHYNWFAAKLIQMDIDYYNVANPGMPWGWKVPSVADFNALSLAINAIGGKLKITGVDLFNSPNTGADNSTGFTAIAAGSRNGSDGLFVNLGSRARFLTVDAQILSLFSADAGLSISAAPNTSGYSIRLLKA